MSGPVLRYGRLRARIAWNLLVRSGIPWPLTVAAAVFGLGAMLQFARLLGLFLARSHSAPPAAFAATTGLVLCVFQLVFAFVAVGSISIRLFDPRRVAEVDLFAALPLRRVDRFLMQTSDVAFLPLVMVAGVICPAMAITASSSGMSLVPAVLLVGLSGLVSLQPVPILIAAYAVFLRAAPAALLRRRGVLFLLFALAVVPLVPVLGGMLTAWKLESAPAEWLPAAWAARAVIDAEAGRFGPAVAAAAAVVGLTLISCAAAYLAYDRAFMERFDEVLAKLQAMSPPEDANVASGRQRRAVQVPKFGQDRIRAALLRKEIVGYLRDPALQLTLCGMGAAGLTFALIAPLHLAMLAVAGIAFLTVYMAACLGLASFSHEGRGFPVLAPLPLDANEVLRAKLLVNTGLLVLAGSAGGALFGLAADRGLLALIAVPFFGSIAAIASAPLGAIVTAMAALFPRRLHRTGQREISLLAMSFFTALTALFYLSVILSVVTPSVLGFAYLWLPLVVFLAWTCLAGALVGAARKAVRLESTEG